MRKLARTLQFLLLLIWGFIFAAGLIGVLAGIDIKIREIVVVSAIVIVVWLLLTIGMCLLIVWRKRRVREGKRAAARRDIVNLPPGDAFPGRNRLRLVETGEVITGEEIRQLELEFNVSLPIDFKRFLLENNGGMLGDLVTFRLTDTDVATQEKHELRDDIQSFYTLDEMRTIYSDLAEKKAVPEKYMPIAEDSLANMILLCLAADENQGCILFADHDKISPGSTFWMTTKIADSFEEFIDSLEKASDYTDDTAYGGFIISKNVNRGRPVRYSFREESAISELNGWTLYSCDDDESYVNNPRNFVIVGASTIYKLAPVMLEIFDAPYGTDLCWLYQDNIHVGFYDLISDRETTIDEILHKRQK